MPTATYYRVLEDLQILTDAGPGPNPNSTLRRWTRGECNSTHNAIPASWVNEWNAGRRQFRQFSLLCAGGLHTFAALRAFLAAATAHGQNNLALGDIPGGDPIVIGELDGACAYSTPEGAWNYVLGGANAADAVPQILSATIVEFTGLDMGIAIPEELHGGVQVKVVTFGNFFKGPNFAKKHHIDLPQEIEAMLNPGNG
ncbi:MAG: hypothetical protein ABSG86_05855 [Thermoguttaceae bacterium]|jgi:hypothetical protein